MAVLDLFGVPWGDLSIEHVEAFLSEEKEEGLVWEAKGTTLHADSVRRSVCGFANSHEGGYLILGAAYRDGGWRLDGFEFPTEARVWIGSVVADGLCPAPAIDVATFPREGGRELAIVQVPSIPVPPCICRGSLYERLPGRTVKIGDPTRLADLFARGRRAASSRRSGSRH